MTDKKRRTISTLVTVFVHVMVLILMMLVTMHLVDQNEMNDGVPVLLGNVTEYLINLQRIMTMKI